MKDVTQPLVQFLAEPSIPNSAFSLHFPTPAVRSFSFRVRYLIRITILILKAFLTHAETVVELDRQAVL
jgi:hypothetical protein